MDVQSASHPSIPRLVTTTLRAHEYHEPDLENIIINIDGADNIVTIFPSTDIVVGIDTIELKKRA